MSHAYVESCIAPEAYTQYITKYQELVTALSGVTGVYRYFLIAQFNMAYLNSEFYSKTDNANLLSVTYENNRPIHKGQLIIEDVLRFMFTTELHQLSGLSFLDLMELDSYTYSLVKKIYEEVEEPKREALNSLQKELQKQTNTNSQNSAFTKAPPRRNYGRSYVRKSSRNR